MNQTCEACERANEDIVESCDDPEYPYHLCVVCHRRLHARSLRPLEWYNLAKRHCWTHYLLHDDFYDDDGTAHQPEEDVEDAGLFPSPTLSDVADNSNALLDYSITRWHLEPEVATAWTKFDPRIVLSVISTRFDSTINLNIREKILSICAAAVGEVGADFVRRAWKQYPEKVALVSLADPSASCLPIGEGFERVKAALADLEGSEKRDKMFSLSSFHSPKSLDWIEDNIFEPITESWGYLAAASAISWPRVETWLRMGRPLSLVAIDALASIVRPMSPFLREYAPELIEPTTVSRFREVLESYRELDAVPRVQKRIDFLLSSTDEPKLRLIND